MGELASAKDTCERALLLIQTDANSAQQDQTSIALFRFNLGQVLKDSKDWEGAITQWQLAAKGQVSPCLTL